jgi:ankyrin repeat protein
MVAAQNGHDRVLETLLARGADVAVKALGGHTALSVAATRGHREIEQRLRLAGRQ